MAAPKKPNENEQIKLREEVALSSIGTHKCNFTNDPTPYGEESNVFTNFTVLKNETDGFNCTFNYDGTPGSGADGIPMEGDYEKCIGDSPNSSAVKT
jgi:hypothetical protein